MKTSEFVEQIHNKDDNTIRFNFISEMYCNKCRDTRRMQFYIWKYKDHSIGQLNTTVIGRKIYKSDLSMDQVHESVFPSLWISHCLQCRSITQIIIYKTDDLEKIAIFQDGYGGISTENTPNSVKYYIDEACKSKSIGAFSASVAMYRAALEQILTDQGYDEKTLHKKIVSLENDLKKDSKNSRLLKMDVELLRVLKNIGNKSIHPNSKDRDKSNVLDMQLVNEIEVIFVEIMEYLYETPLKEASRKEKLKQVNILLK